MGLINRTQALLSIIFSMYYVSTKLTVLVTLLVIVHHGFLNAETVINYVQLMLTPWIDINCMVMSCVD